MSDISTDYSCWVCAAEDLPSSHSWENCPEQSFSRSRDSGNVIEAGAEGNQDSEQAGNVIITEDQVLKTFIATHGIKGNTFANASSSEPMYDLGKITDRWMVIDTVTINSSQGLNTTLMQLELPGSLIRADADAPNLMAFYNYLYGEFDVEILFKTNSNQFQCGRLVVSALTNPLHIWNDGGDYYDVRSAITRPHQFIELNGSQETIMKIDWNYHRSFVRLSDTGFQNNYGIQSGVYVTVLVQVFAPLNVGSTAGSDKVDLTAFFRFTRARFTGMSYRKSPTVVAPQMLTFNVKRHFKHPGRKPQSQMFASATSITKSFKDRVQQVEDVLDYTSKITNLDKPTNVIDSIIVCPRPRLNFTHGKGSCDAVPLRLDPGVTTTFYKDHLQMLEYSSVKQIMRIWGNICSYTWKKEDQNGSNLGKLTISPSNFSPNEESVRPISPLELITGMYQFWRGTIDLRIDFISTSFHTGTVAISIEFGREATSTESSYGSTYVKNFDLGQQKSVTITIPYIYDTIWRRTTNVPINCAYTNVGDRVCMSGIIHGVNATINVRVLNAIKPPETVAGEIKMLFFVRAGSSYSVHSLISQAWMFNSRMLDGTTPQDFPVNFPQTVAKRRAVEGPKTYYVKPQLGMSDPIAFRKTIAQYGYNSSTGGIDLSKQLKELSSKMETEIKFNKVKTQDIDLDLHNVSPIPTILHQTASAVPQGDDATDNTLSFMNGQAFKNIQTKEKFMNIKDILRRPIMITCNATVQPNTQGDYGNFFMFCIPLMPPSMNLACPNSSGLFSSGIARSPHVTLTSLFRYWRGEMRYTLIFKDFEPSSVIYIHTMPRSGIAGFGNCNWLSGGYQDKSNIYVPYNIAMSGLPTEIVIPSMNPTIQVEVPFMTESNWCLLNQGPSPAGINTNYDWFDHTDDNVGHLLINSSHNCTVDIFWAAGDTFEITGFLGTLSGRNLIPKHCVIDNKPTTQMLPASLSCAKHLISPAIIGTTTFLGGPSLGMTSAAMIYASKAEKLISGMMDSKDQVDNVITNVKKFTESSCELQSLTMGDIKNITQSSSSLLANIDAIVKALMPKNSSTIIYDKLVFLVLEFHSAWDNPKPKIIAGSIIKILLHFKMITMQHASVMINGLITFIKSFSPSSQSIREDPDSFYGFGKDAVAAFCGLVIGVVSAIMNTEVNKANFIFKTCDLFKNMTKSSTWSTIGNATRFFKDVLVLFQRAYRYVAGFKDPQVDAYEMLSGKSEFLKRFITEAQQFLLEVNASALRRLTSEKLKFWVLVTNAYQIQAKIIQYPGNQISPMLGGLCRDVIKKSQELNVALSNAPIRYEPFVLCISGPSQVGKSHMTNKLVTTMLKSVGFEDITSEIVYVKSPGPEYWNGYRDQPVVVFDDYLNIRTQQDISSHVSDLFNLKSTAVFNPNMARIEEKEIRANPLIVVLLMNQPYPNLDVVSCPEAFLRRRDMVIQVDRTSEYQVKDSSGNFINNRELPSEIRKCYGHLQFQEYPNPREDILDPTIYTYQGMVERICERFRKYHDQEQENIVERIKDINDLLPKEAMKCTNIGDPFSVLHKTLIKNSTPYTGDCILPSERLDEEVERILSELKLKEDKSELPIETQMDNYFQVPIGSTDDSFSMVYNPEYEPPLDFIPPIKQIETVGDFFTKLKLRIPKSLQEDLIFRKSLIHGLVMCERNEDRIKYYLQLKMNALRPFFDKCTECCEIKLIEYACHHHEEYLTSYPSTTAVKMCKTCAFMCMDEHQRVKCPKLCNQEMTNIEEVKYYHCTMYTFAQEYLKDFSIQFILKLFRGCEALTMSLSYNNTAIGALIAALTTYSGDPFVRCLGYSISLGVSTYRVFIEDKIGCSLLTPISAWASLIRKSLTWFSIPDVWRGVFDGSKHTPIMSGSEQTRWSLINYFNTFARYKRNQDRIRNGLPPLDEEEASEDGSLDLYQETQSNISENEQPVFQIWTNDEHIPYMDMIKKKSKRVTEQCLHKYSHNTNISFYNHHTAPDCFMGYDFEDKESFIFPNALCANNCVWDHQSHFDFLKKYYDDNKVMIGVYLEGTVIDPRQAIPAELIPKGGSYYRNEEWYELVKKKLDETSEIPWWKIIVFKGLEYLPDIMYFMSIVSGFLIAFKGLSSISSYFRRTDDGDEPQMGGKAYTGESTPRKLARGRGIRIANRSKPTSQSASSFDAAEQYIQRNMGQIIITSPQGEIITWCTFVGIAGKKALFMEHYVHSIRKLLELKPDVIGYIRPVSDFNLKIPVNIQTLAITGSGISDIVYLHLPPNYPIFKDIRKFFPKIEMMSNREIYHKATMIEPPSKAELKPMLTKREILINKYLPELEISDPVIEDYIVEDILEYNYSRKGACGAMIMTTNLETPIIGVHIAGRGDGFEGKGYAVLVYRDYFDAVEFDGIMDIEDCNKLDVECQNARITLPEEVKLTVLGTVPNGVFVPSKTNSTHSIIGNELKPFLSAPVILTGSDPRYVHRPSSPLVDGVLKHGNIPGALCLPHVNEITLVLSQFFSKFAPIRLVNGPLTYSEAICGFKHLDMYDTIPMDTSSGWPWSSETSVKDKTAWIDLVRDKDLYAIEAKLHPKLLNELQRKENLRQKGIVPFTVFTDLLKDERKPIEKIKKKGGTRIFCASPLDFTISIRQYFLDFYNALCNNRLQSMISIGISVDGPQWGELAHHLLEVGNNMFSFDYKDFGPSYSAEAMNAIRIISTNWAREHGFSAKDIQQMNIMMMELTNSKHIATNLIYEQYCGSPSGSSVTAPQNSLINIFFIVYAWMGITNRGFSEFQEHIRATTYGDDGVISVSDTYRDVFNAETVINFFNGQGIVVTAADKSDNIEPYTTLKNITFLKRAFVKHPTRAGEFLAPLPTISIEETAKWIHKKEDFRAATMENAEQSIRMGYGRGPQYFNQWMVKVNEALRYHRLDPVLLTWTELDNNFFGEMTVKWISKRRIKKGENQTLI